MTDNSLIEGEYIVEKHYTHDGWVFPVVKKKLIRCKDCKYWLQHTQFGFDEDNGEYHNYCERLVPEDDYYAFVREADDYCSMAERKEE